jgi:hypothetical protein
MSDDLEYMGYNFVKSARKKFYAKISFKDTQTKRWVSVYDFSGLDSASLAFEHFGKQGYRWRIAGVVNTVGEQNFLVLQRFGFMRGGVVINPYRDEEGMAEIELVG